MKILFLDIDGVLNNHTYDEVAGTNSFLPQCVEQLNRIIDKTGAKIVLSSSWRYMILMGAMSLTGFQYLLRTHGVTEKIDIVGVTEQDQHFFGEKEQRKNERARQIHNFLSQLFENDGFLLYKGHDTYVILDDGYRYGPDNYHDHGIPAMFPDNVVMTDGDIGLTKENADKAILILNGDYKD